MADATTNNERPKKRAIALAGGGPAAGFHIGVLSALEDYRLSFDVWSLSCIGAWVGVYYNQLTQDDKAARTYDFFKTHAFRDTDSYSGFPVNKAFAPNLNAHASAWMNHALSPKTYWDVFNFRNDLPDAAAGWARFLTTPEMWWREGDVNAHVLNNILAVNPMSRFMTSLAYLSGVNGLSNIYYKDSTFLDGIRIGALDLIDVKDQDRMSRQELEALAGNYHGPIERERRTMPEIYHNAWRLADTDAGITGELQLFNNKWLDYRGDKIRRTPRNYLPITRPSLCACSALPYVEQTVQIPNDDNRHYSEGALVDTVSFRNLVEDHPDLDEIWVCRIVDYRQLRLQKNLHDSLGNLCQQFAAEVGENDIDLFKSHLRKSVGRIPRVVEIPLEPETKIDYRWDHENLEIGFAEGRKAVHKLLDRQRELQKSETSLPKWGV
ncbi:patatin-like phospholipase family protein [Aquincola sp. S2]|uniref:Patatin-like phospholipase family protein n=1 Tax=Pseudaquabacterium terrae TaxID=2732868 RepID=A0ABX2EFR0_9BURK|nr:patatin-like phospholipase family protein [Aquabacterium terrae]NRF67470.1 patatin-like phospholipase family protein [Aquabacterium terrae]